jgi:chromosome segregation ATPase
MEIQKKLQEELQTLRVINNKLQKKYETKMGTEVKLRTELERVKFANDNLNKYWESKMDCEEEKKFFVIRNHEIQKELKATKTNVPMQNLQFVGCSSQPQQAVGVE